MGDRSATAPLTPFQAEITRLLSKNRPPEESGCLYYSFSSLKFVADFETSGAGADVKTHYPCPGGVFPSIG